MIDYTPYHQYSEIHDYIPEKKAIIKSKIIGYSLLLLYVGIIILLVTKMLTWPMFFSWSSLFDFIEQMFWVFILAIIIGFIFVAIYAFNSPGETRLKADYANAIKDVIGFDFGDDFKLLFTSSHDYEEYLYVFTEESFGPLKDHLESMKEGKQEDTGRVVKHCYNGKEGAGFTLVENRIVDCCGNVESIKVDYDGRTLKHTYIVF